VGNRIPSSPATEVEVIATANKIATIYYKMVRYRQEFNPIELELHQQKYKQAKIASLERELSQLKKDAA